MVIPSIIFNYFILFVLFYAWIRYSCLFFLILLLDWLFVSLHIFLPHCFGFYPVFFFGLLWLLPTPASLTWSLKLISTLTLFLRSIEGIELLNFFLFSPSFCATFVIYLVLPCFISTTKDFILYSQCSFSFTHVFVVHICSSFLLATQISRLGVYAFAWRISFRIFFSEIRFVGRLSIRLLWLKCLSFMPVLWKIFLFVWCYFCPSTLSSGLHS